MKASSSPQTEINHVKFASMVLQSKRAAIDLSVDQVQQMAGIILVLDHDLTMSQERAAMMLAEAVSDESNDSKAVFVEGKSRTNTAIINRFIDAYAAYEAAKFGSDENITRQKFEKAAIAMAGIYKPKGYPAP